MTKNSIDRKQEILSIAGNLFITKGFDKTTINDILNEAGIAKGTLYYYFKSKEEMMDSLIESYTDDILRRVQTIKEQEESSILEKLFFILSSMNMEGEGNDAMIEYMHRPQNALMHEKTNRIIIEKITPLLADLVSEGVNQGIFSTIHPYDAVEIILVYSIHAFGHEFMEKPHKEKIQKIESFLYSLERLFGAEEGIFDVLKEMIYGGSHE